MTMNTNGLTEGAHGIEERGGKFIK